GSHGRQGVCSQAAQSAPGKGGGPWRIRLQSSQGTGSWEAGPWSQDRRQEEVGPRGRLRRVSPGSSLWPGLGRRGPQAGLGLSQARSRSRVWPAPCPLRLEGTEALVGLCGTSHSRAKAEAALTAAQKAQEEARIARITAKEFSPSFQHRENGLEYQRPKHQLSSDDIEVTSTGTPPQQESPELYRKGTTPSDLTPDDSPLQSFPASPTATPPPAPAARNKVAHFSRQVSVDEERGGDIQMLLEGRGGDYARNSWAEEKAGGSRGIRSGALRSSQPADDFRTRGAGHKQSGNPKPRERRTESPTTFSWTSHHRAGNPGPGGPRLLELDEEKLSNYEMEMKPLLRMDSYAQDVHPPKRRYSKGGAGRGPGEDHRADDRAFGAQRLRSKSQNKEHARPAPCTEPAVQRLESLRLGDRAEPRLLRWDLTFSPPQRSSPVALESDDENGDELKAST
ncbi:hypothetical protein FD755_003652, partial [Muntiacus reevesi]